MLNMDGSSFVEVGSILEGVSPKDLFFSDRKVIRKDVEIGNGRPILCYRQSHDKNGTTVADGNGSCVVDSAA